MISISKGKNTAKGLLVTGAVMAAILGGCVQIETPTQPIVINLNISIKQEIAVKLDGNAKELIEQNGSVF
jgi:YnbE-like lipoprotein